MSFLWRSANGMKCYLRGDLQPHEALGMIALEVCGREEFLCEVSFSGVRSCSTFVYRGCDIALFAHFPCRMDLIISLLDPFQCRFEPWASLINFPVHGTRFQAEFGFSAPHRQPPHEINLILHGLYFRPKVILEHPDTSTAKNT